MKNFKNMTVMETHIKVPIILKFWIIELQKINIKINLRNLEFKKGKVSKPYLKNVFNLQKLVHNMKITCFYSNFIT